MGNRLPFYWHKLLIKRDYWTVVIKHEHSWDELGDDCIRNVQVNREDFNLLLLIVVFVVFQDHFLSITATMMDCCWRHATHSWHALLSLEVALSALYIIGDWSHLEVYGYNPRQHVSFLTVADLYLRTM